MLKNLSQSKLCAGAIVGLVLCAQIASAALAIQSPAASPTKQVKVNADIAVAGNGGPMPPATISFTVTCYNQSGGQEQAASGMTNYVYFAATLTAPPWSLDTFVTRHKIEVVDGNGTVGNNVLVHTIPQ